MPNKLKVDLLYVHYANGLCSNLRLTPARWWSVSTVSAIRAVAPVASTVAPTATSAIASTTAAITWTATSASVAPTAAVTAASARADTATITPTSAVTPAIASGSTSRTASLYASVACLNWTRWWLTLFWSSAVLTIWSPWSARFRWASVSLGISGSSGTRVPSILFALCLSFSPFSLPFSDAFLFQLLLKFLIKCCTFNVISLLNSQSLHHLFVFKLFSLWKLVCLMSA